MISYVNRHEAGALLAKLLFGYAGQQDAVVLALPRGGVPVAYEVAERLGLPMDLIPVQRLRLPGHEELSMGAIAPGGIRVENEPLVFHLRVPEEQIREVEARERLEMEQQLREYRGEHPAPDLRGKQIILVDDGLFMENMRAAIAAVRAQQAARVIVAVPVAPPEALDEIGDEADEVVCPLTSDNFLNAAQWYRNDFHTTDQDVRDLLAHAWREHPSGDHGAGG